MPYSRHEIEWTPEKASRLWDYYGSSPSHRQLFFGYLKGEVVVRRIDREVGLRHQPRILDLSCGPGDLIAALLDMAGPGQEICGTDMSPASIDVVNERFRGEERFGGAELVAGFPSRFEAGSFDLVIATEVVEHLTDPELEAMLRECARLVRPGGYLALSTPNNEDYDQQKVLCPDCGCVFHRWQHMRTWTASSLREAVEPHGFTTIKSEATAWVAPWRDLLSAVKPVDRYGLFYLGRRGHDSEGG